MDEVKGQFISIFKYGSVVLFNLPEGECQQHINMMKNQGAIQPFTDDVLHTEQYEVLVKKSLDEPSRIQNEHIDLRRLDINNLSIISTVMAQTVALDYYAQRVDRMIDKFLKMNINIEETGNFNTLDHKQLFKLLASNSTIIATVLSRLGLFEGLDSAWQSAENTKTWEGLRKEFEVDQRYKDLSLKLDIIQNNSRFFLEMLQNNQSHKLEWIIIALIGCEIVIGVTSLVVQCKT